MSRLGFEGVLCSLLQQYIHWRIAESLRRDLAILALDIVKVEAGWCQYEIFAVFAGELLGFLCRKDCTWIAKEEKQSVKCPSRFVKFALRLKSECFYIGLRRQNLTRVHPTDTTQYA